METKEPMNLDEFQQACERTFGGAEYDYSNRLQLAALGVGGEAGEVLELVKKELHHGHERDDEKAVKEVGDVLYYLAVFCTTKGFRLQDAMERNVAKLRVRYPDGFDSGRSQNKQEDKE